MVSYDQQEINTSCDLLHAFLTRFIHRFFAQTAQPKDQLFTPPEGPGDPPRAVFPLVSSKWGEGGGVLSPQQIKAAPVLHVFSCDYCNCWSPYIFTQDQEPRPRPSGHGGGPFAPETLKVIKLMNKRQQHLPGQPKPSVGSCCSSRQMCRSWEAAEGGESYCESRAFLIGPRCVELVVAV